jgi:hypothetical protein
MFLTRLGLVDDPQPGMWVVNAPLVWSDPVFGSMAHSCEAVVMVGGQCVSN